MSKLSGRKEWKKRKPSFYTGAWGSGPPFLSPVWGHAAPTKGLPNISQGNIRVRMGKPSPGSALCHHQKSFCLFHRSVVFVLPHDLFSQNLYFWNSSKNCGVVKRSPFWKAAAKTQPVPPGGFPQPSAGGRRLLQRSFTGQVPEIWKPPGTELPPGRSGAGNGAAPGSFVLCGGAPRAAARPSSRLPRGLPAAGGDGGGEQLPAALSHPPPLWEMPPTYEQPGEPPAPDHGGRCSASSAGGARPPLVPAELSGAQRAAVRPWDVPVPAARLGTAAAARGRLGSSHKLSKRS